MIASFDDLFIIQYHDCIKITESRKLMGNDENSFSAISRSTSFSMSVCAQVSIEWPLQVIRQVIDNGGESMDNS